MMEPAREIEVLKRRIETSTRLWVRAAQSALQAIPGASCSSHPAHDLWLRVELASAPPMQIAQSTGEPDHE